MDILIALIIGLALLEFGAWLPGLCRWIVALAVSILPSDERERWREEYNEAQQAFPHSLTRLVHAISLCWGGIYMRIGNRQADSERDFDALDAGISSLVRSHARILSRHKGLANFEAWDEVVESNIITLEAQISSLRTASSSDPNIRLAAITLQERLQTINDRRANDLREARNTIETTEKYLDTAGPMFERLSGQWSKVRNLWQYCRRVPILGNLVIAANMYPVLKQLHQLISLNKGMK